MSFLPQRSSGTLRLRPSRHPSKVNPLPPCVVDQRTTIVILSRQLRVDRSTSGASTGHHPYVHTTPPLDRTGPPDLQTDASGPSRDYLTVLSQTYGTNVVRHCPTKFRPDVPVRLRLLRVPKVGVGSLGSGSTGTGLPTRGGAYRSLDPDPGGHVVQVPGGSESGRGTVRVETSSLSLGGRTLHSSFK